MQFVQEYPLINEKIQLLIKEYIENDTREYEASQVYDSITDEKTFAPEKRQSEFKTFLCHEHTVLTSFCQNYVDEINKINNHITFILVPNDITHIRYQEGGFFKSHEDFLSLTSNMIEEYTLIMCLFSKDLIGGETILHLNEHFKHNSKATTTPLNTLIFRKDITHEGALIKHGRKEIMTLNLWGISRNDTERIIIVSFTKNKIMDNRTYVFDIEDVRRCSETNLLKTFINFKDLSRVDKVLRYDETNFTYEQFAIIAQIYNKQKIDYTIYTNSLEIIDYYGFNWQNLLIKLFNKDLNIFPKPKVLTVNEESDESDQGKESDESTQGKKSDKGKESDQGKDSDKSKESKDRNSSKVVDENLILCGDRAKYLQFMDIVKNTQLQYMPFKMILAEGTFTYGHGMSGTPPLEISMQPVWISVSERNNILYYQNLVTTYDPSEHNFQNVFNLADTWQEFMEDKVESDDEGSFGSFSSERSHRSEDELSEEEDESERVSQYWNEKNYKKFMKKKDSTELQLFIREEHDDTDDYSNAIHIITDHDSYFNNARNLSLFFYTPDKNEKIIKSIIMDRVPLNNLTLYKSGIIQEKDIILETENYVLDSFNNLAILPKHFSKVIKVISNFNGQDLVERVIAKLDETNFNLPQKTDENQHFFCNESVYSKLLSVVVYGFFKM
jgi:hypothetical protein